MTTMMMPSHHPQHHGYHHHLAENERWLSTDYDIVRLDESHIVEDDNDLEAADHKKSSSSLQRSRSNNGDRVAVDKDVVPLAVATVEDLSQPLLPSQVLPIIQNGPQNNDDMIPTASAMTVEEETTFPTDSSVRPEFLFAVAIKSRIDTKVGLSFQDHPKGGVMISRIAPNSLFRHCNLRPGDRVFAVNNRSCLRATKHRIVDRIQETPPGYRLSICVRNGNGGDPNTVSTSVPKPTPTTKVGVALQSRRRGGAVRVSRVDDGGLFGQTLLAAHHRCLAINGRPCHSGATSQQAADWIASASERVTIVSRPEPESMALVLAASSAACQTHEAWWQKAAVGVGLAAVGAALGSMTSG